MKFGVIVFPGTWSDRDCGWVIDQVLGAELTYLWHKDADLKGCDCVILPGGFAYGDYLRCGAIARVSPIVPALRAHAERGGWVLGVCNGFQILTEVGLLPGALTRNAHQRFECAPPQRRRSAKPRYQPGRGEHRRPRFARRYRSCGALLRSERRPRHE